MRGLVQFEQRGQAGAATGCGVAADAGVDDRGRDFFLCQALFQQRDPTRSACRPYSALSESPTTRMTEPLAEPFLPASASVCHAHNGQGGQHDKVTPHHRNQLREPFMSETIAVPAQSLAATASQAPIIDVAHVHKSVTDSTGTLEILRDIDFTLAERETVAIVGASGSGKSTLLSIIAGLDTPTRGTVRLAGEDLFALNEDERRAACAQTGFVFQSFQLLGNLTALENVMLPLELAGTATRAGAPPTCWAVGLAQRLRITQVLSGGEQQRVALARAFVVQPAVLLADEPTGSLDFATGETIMELMFALNREQGTTLVLVTHDRAIAERCDRRITIEAGRLV
jgi:putative ABC transport system ATP-binding protein